MIRPNRRGKHLQNFGRMKGGLDMNSIMNFVKKAVGELRRGKYISKGADLYSQSGLPYSGVVGTVGKLAGQAGFGRRRTGRPRVKASGVVRRPRIVRKPGKPTCGGMCGGKKRLAQRRVVPVQGRVFGKGLNISGGYFPVGKGLKISGSGVKRKTVFP